MIGSVGVVPEVVSGLSCGRGVLFAPLGYIPAVCAEIACVPASAHSTANHHEENVQFISTLCPPNYRPVGQGGTLRADFPIGANRPTTGLAMRVIPHSIRRTGRKTLPKSTGSEQCAGFGVRASAGRVAAKRVTLLPFDPVRGCSANGDGAFSHWRTHRQLSVVLRPRVAARSPMSGAWLPRTKAGACGRESLIQSSGPCGSSAAVPACR